MSLRDDRFSIKVGAAMVTLTGRTRPYKPKGYTAMGVRSDHVAREYKCSCGYTGWSNHNDLRLKEAAERKEKLKT